MTFADKEGLLQALKMTSLTLGGRTLRVEVAKPQRGGGNRRGESSQGEGNRETVCSCSESKEQRVAGVKLPSHVIESRYSSGSGTEMTLLCVLFFVVFCVVQRAAPPSCVEHSH